MKRTGTVRSAIALRVQYSSQQVNHKHFPWLYHVKATIISIDCISQHKPSLSHILRRTATRISIPFFADIEALKKCLYKPVFKARNWYKKDFEKNVRTLPTFERGQFFHENKSPRAVLASEVDNFAAAPYNKLVPRASVMCKIITVRDTSLTILEDPI